MEGDMVKPGWRSKVAGITLCAILMIAVTVKPGKCAEDPAKYPSKPITLIVQFGPGGMTDTTARKLAEIAGKALGQPVVVENKPGGAGVIAFSAVAKAPSDGYTLGTVSAPLAMVPHLRNVPFKVKEDFTYIMRYLNNVQAFMVAVDSRWKTLKDFMAEARDNPGKLTVADMGAKSVTDVIVKQLAMAEKVNLSFVPTSSGGEVQSLLLGGHVQAGFAGELILLRTGKIKALAVFAEQRLSEIPDVPTLGELGYKIDAPLWSGIAGPKDLNPQIVKKLGDAFKKAYDDPSYKELCKQLMTVPSFEDAEGFRKAVFNDYDNQAAVLKRIGYEKE
jgi:tripartite-type tricarboxylate transporter receptor subunit TctC